MRQNLKKSVSNMIECDVNVLSFGSDFSELTRVLMLRTLELTIKELLSVIPNLYYLGMTKSRAFASKSW